jgi:thiol:disulfide interchange protein DsbD
MMMMPRLGEPPRNNIASFTKAINPMNWIRRSVGFFLILLLTVCNSSAEAQGEKPKKPRKFENAVKKVETTVAPSTAKRGETVIWRLTIELDKDWHTYPTVQTDPEAQSYVTQITLEPPPGLIVVDKLKDPSGEHTKAEPVLKIKVLKYYEGTFSWELPLVVDPRTQPGTKEIKAEITLTVCDAVGCLLPKTLNRSTTLNVSDAPAVPVDPKYKTEVDKALAAPETPKKITLQASPDPGPSGGGGSDGSISSGSQSSGLLAFILQGIFWGAVSLITPCVFPMIPITVSFFLKQSESQHHRPLTMATVYCLTIVTVLTIAAVAFLSFFRALSTNPIMNMVIGGLFVFFALSLFGMYDIELPSGLARFTSAREGQGGLIGTVFMALTFTIISFACVAPFLGGFGGTAANSNLTWTHRLLGGLAFAVTFASPFFVLALFPVLLKKMPKSGSWLNTVKVVMGFLELAAAIKFFRAGELVLLEKPTFFTYDFALGLYVALSLLCGVYLLGLYRLPHDTPSEHLGVPRLMFSLTFLGLAFYLAPALFKNGSGENQRPSGVVFAWLDSFLLPDEQETDLPWHGDLQRALAEAKEKGKLVFVDFTGETCTNCKLNERNVFPKPDIKNAMLQYTLVQLYTDKVPSKYYSPEERAKPDFGPARLRADAQKHLEFQRKEFDTEELPLYAILQPLGDGKYKVLGTMGGLIQSEAEFLGFLRKPLASNGTLAVSERSEELLWSGDLPKALAEARAQKKLLFVGFDGMTNTNCKWNERKFFSKPAIKNTLRQYTQVMLCTDKVPASRYSAEERARPDFGDERQRADAKKNLEFQLTTFDTQELPLYAIVQPLRNGELRILETTGGLIQSEADFLAFLTKPFAGISKVTQAGGR